MIVEYEKSIIEKIDDKIIEAKKNNKVISSIILDLNETEEMKEYICKIQNKNNFFDKKSNYYDSYDNAIIYYNGIKIKLME